MAQDIDNDNDKKTPEERAKHRTEVMTKELGLAGDQVDKVNSINLDFARHMAEVKAITDEASRRGRAEALKNKRDAQLKGVLTADQYTKMMDLREKKKTEAKEKKKDTKPEHKE